MKLLIDIGNTRVKWALADKQLTLRGDGEDWSHLEPHRDSIHSAWVSCVGKRSTLKKVVKQIKELGSLHVNIAKVTPSASGLVNQYKDLDRLGVDRWVAAIGARALQASGDLIVVDVGTAVTIDAVDAANNYLGGVILPGFTMMHDSLVGRTAGIRSQRQEALSVIGKNTQECVNAGAHYGVIGAIERIVSEMQVNLKSDSQKLIITGGDAEIVTASSHLQFEYQSNLVFDGLIALSECPEIAKNALLSES